MATNEQGIYYQRRVSPVMDEAQNRGFLGELWLDWELMAAAKADKQIVMHTTTGPCWRAVLRSAAASTQDRLRRLTTPSPILPVVEDSAAGSPS